MTENELVKIYSLMERMGENVSGPENMLLYYENGRIPIVTCEGLIKSYDTDRVVSFISDAFGFETDKLSLRKIKGDVEGTNVKNGSIGKISMSNGCDGIKIFVPFDFGRKKELDHYMRKYGWINSRIDNDGGMVLIYEKKFDESFFCRQLRNYVSFLYHITDRKNVSNIFKKGLKAVGSKNENGYMNDERIYLFLNEPDVETREMLFGKDSVVLRVDLSKVGDDIRFYFDPRIENALYVREPIWKNAIEVV